MVKYSEQQLDLVFHALAHRVRRRLLRHIMDGHDSVLELARPFQMSLAAVSKHLKVLEKAGLIKRTKEGRMYHFQAVAQPIEGVEAWIKAYSQFWDEQLDSLDTFLTS